MYCRFLESFCGVFVPRREKEGILSEAIQSFKEALEIDNNQQTARDHLEKIELQIKVKEQVRKSMLPPPSSPFLPLEFSTGLVSCEHMCTG